MVKDNRLITGGAVFCKVCNFEQTGDQFVIRSNGKFAHSTCLSLSKDFLGTIQKPIHNGKSQVSQHWHCQDCQENEQNPYLKCPACDHLKKIGYEGFRNFKTDAKGNLKPKRKCLIAN